MTKIERENILCSTIERREAEELYRTLAKSSPVGVYIVQDGKFRFINPRFQRYTGYSEVELLGTAPLELIHPEDRERVRENAVAMLKGNRLSPYELRYIVKGGDIMWSTETVTSIHYYGRRATLGNFMDITERKQMEEALRKSEKELAIIFDTSSDAIRLIDTDFKIIRTNASMTALSGIDPQASVGRNCYDVFKGNQCQTKECPLTRVLKTKVRISTETVKERQDGEKATCIITASPLIDERGVIFGIMEDFVDITGRRQMEERLRKSRQRYRELADSLPQIVWEVNEKGVVTFMNRQGANTFGYSPEEGSDSSLGVIPEDRDRVGEHMIRVWIGEESGGIEYTALRKDGSTFPVISYVVPIIGENGIEGMRGVTIDITDRKQAEEALKQKMEELRAANLKLQELDKMKDSFLSTVSHELRTPLTSIRSFAEILLTYDEDRDTQREFLTIINDESDRLTKLINDFLDLSKIESGRMQWETVELSLIPVIQNAMNITQAIAKQKNLTVEFNAPENLPIISCDKDRLVQVVTNLLSNAIKFTPEEGKISVGVRVVEASEADGESGIVIVSVADTGTGISPENHEAVFEKFKQVGDTLTDKPQGTGLGLPICKEIMEHYGGKIWVESELDQGSTFSFSLPIVAPKDVEVTPEVEEDEPAPIDVGSGTILVVDDEDNIRRFLAYELTKRGVSCL